eukprot:scaffold1736_cov127-Cylindrotheca_fusiformis.AAC.52
MSVKKSDFGEGNNFLLVTVHGTANVPWQIWKETRRKKERIMGEIMEGLVCIWSQCQQEDFDKETTAGFGRDNSEKMICRAN